MLSFRYADNLTPNISPDDVAFNNMKAADKCMDIALFSAAMNAWIKNDKTRTFQDVELLLREHCENTYIYPKIGPIPDNFKLKRINENENDEECLYELNISSGPNKYGLKTVTDIWENYETSFDNLKYAGQLVAKSDKITIPKSDDDDDEVFIFNPTQAGFLNAVLRNKICLIIVETNHK